MLHDNIADMITRIRNAGLAQHRYVDVPLSKMNKSIADVLAKKGLIGKILSDEKKRVIRLFLKFDANRQLIIHGLKRMSKPGRRYYVGKDKIPYVMDGLGTAVMSTPKGVMDGETAREMGVGGEVLFKVW